MFLIAKQKVTVIRLFLAILQKYFKESNKNK